MVVNSFYTVMAVQHIVYAAKRFADEDDAIGFDDNDVDDFEPAEDDNVDIAKHEIVDTMKHDILHTETKRCDAVYKAVYNVNIDVTTDSTHMVSAINHVKTYIYVDLVNHQHNNLDDTLDTKGFNNKDLMKHAS